MRARAPSSPDWDQLYETAAGQEGLFTTRQAAAAGYSRPLLTHHTRSGRIQRLGRGIYRLVHFPAGEHEDLVRAWLWSDRAGVMSHQTALALHGLSDVLPAAIHLTVPSAWRRRRLRVPQGVVLHFDEIAPGDREWVDAVPVTVAARTLNDCARAALGPELLRQAARQALQRGLVARRAIRPVDDALAPFGGIEA